MYRYYVVTPVFKSWATSKKKACIMADAQNCKSLRIYDAAGKLLSHWIKGANGKWRPIPHEPERIVVPNRAQTNKDLSRPSEEHLSIHEYARSLGVRPITVYDWIRKGVLSHTYHRGHRWILKGTARPCRDESRFVWSNKHPACIRCNSTDWHHQAKGLCRHCYLADYRSKKNTSQEQAQAVK